MFYIPSRGWRSDDIGSGDCRDAVIRFWLSIPIDQLQFLWSGSIGDVTRQLAANLSNTYELSPEQLKLRDDLNQKVGALGVGDPFAHQLIVALFPLSPPGLFKIANASKHLPAWLLNSYVTLYETPQQNVTVLGGPVATPQPSASTTPNAAGPSSLPEPDFGPFPTSLSDLVTNRIQLNRMLGLSNLYYIDPEDQDITRELLGFRRSLAALIQASPEADLERVWSTDFGDRYWSLVRSGVQSVALDPDDQVIKAQATERLNSSGGGFGSDKALNAFFVALMYYPPTAIRVENPEQKLPAWLLKSYSSLMEQSQPIGI